MFVWYQNKNTTHNNILGGFRYFGFCSSHSIVTSTSLLLHIYAECFLFFSLYFAEMYFLPYHYKILLIC